MPAVSVPDGDGDVGQMSVPAPLGPGDADPRSTVQVARPVEPPLGPGDTPRDATVQAMPDVKPAAGPGDSVGPESEYEMRALPAFGPGDIAVPRPAIRLKRKAISHGEDRVAISRNMSYTTP